MRGFILAAGLGTRLRPLTLTTPKPLVPIGGEPLLARAIKQLRDAGVREIAVNAFHLADQIIEFVGDGSQFGVSAQVFDERPLVLGTGGGLKNAEAFLCAGDEPFVLVNADVWHNFDLKEFIAGHRRNNIATMAMHVSDRRPELHTVGCARNGRIAHVAQKPVDIAADFVAIYTGVAVIEPRLLAFFPSNEVCSLVGEGLWPAMRVEETLAWLEPKGGWFDCGTHAEVLRASAFALRARRKGERGGSASAAGL